MIPIQIASDITTVGVEGVRWVLVDASEDDPPAPSMASPALPTAAAALAVAPPDRGGQRRIGRWQLAITGLGLLAAVGLAQRQLGWPKLPGLAAPAVSLPVAAPPAPLPADAMRLAPVPVTPVAPADPPPAAPTESAGAGQALPAPAASAAQPERLITAELR